MPELRPSSRFLRDQARYEVQASVASQLVEAWLHGLQRQGRRIAPPGKQTAFTFSAFSARRRGSKISSPMYILRQRHIILNRDTILAGSKLSCQLHRDLSDSQDASAHSGAPEQNAVACDSGYTPNVKHDEINEIKV